MTVLELSRWQFGITTVYRFIFVPLTLSLSCIVGAGGHPAVLEAGHVAERGTNAQLTGSGGAYQRLWEAHR